MTHSSSRTRLRFHRRARVANTLCTALAGRACAPAAQWCCAAAVLSGRPWEQKPCGPRAAGVPGPAGGVGTLRRVFRQTEHDQVACEGPVWGTAVLNCRRAHAYHQTVLESQHWRDVPRQFGPRVSGSLSATWAALLLACHSGVPSPQLRPHARLRLQVLWAGAP